MGWCSTGAVRKIPAMRQEQHIWRREHRRDGPSEWPSTGFSTSSGELHDEAKARRLQHRSGYVRFALLLVVVLAASAGGILAIARHLHG